MLTGTVRRRGEPVAGAAADPQRDDRGGRATTSTGADGGYRLRLPPPGHHILTVLAPDRLVTLSVKIFTTTQSAVTDVELPTDHH